MAAAARYFWEERDWKSVIVVPKKGLAAQTVKRLKHYYGNDLSVGQCGDGQRTVGDVTVATAQTLIHFLPWKKKGMLQPPDQGLKKLLEKAKVLFLDEAHHASADSWYTISMHSKALRKFGLSGTPLKNDALADLRLVGATGDIICNIEATDLIELGINAEPKIIVVYSSKASGPELPTKHYIRYEKGEKVAAKRYLPWAEAYVKGLVENDFHNRAVIRAVEWMVDQGRRVMVLCRRKPHWRKLKKMLEATGLPVGAYWGNTPVFEREDGKRMMQEGSIKVILATTIFDEGEDVPAVNGLVLAEGVKVSINAIQRLGRGMRKKGKGESNDVWVVDFCPTCHPTLASHSLERVVAWEGEGYDVRVWEDWPDDDEELVLPFLTWDLTS
jgi:superfamily II DNA or RNA helicase